MKITLTEQYINIEELKAENKRLLNANILLSNERIRLKEDIALIKSDLEDALQENVYIVDQSIDIAEENAKLKVSFFTHHCNFMNVIKVCDIKNLVHATEDIKQAESIYESISKLKD